MEEKQFLQEVNMKQEQTRIFEVFEKELKKKPKFIINLQGDMPNLDPFGNQRSC